MSRKMERILLPRDHGLATTKSKNEEFVLSGRDKSQTEENSEVACCRSDEMTAEDGHEK